MIYLLRTGAWQTFRLKRFSHLKEEEYGTTELLHSRSITIACQKYDSRRMDIRPRKDNPRTWECWCLMHEA